MVGRASGVKRVTRSSLCNDDGEEDQRQRESVRVKPASPLIDRVREYTAVPRSGLKIRAVFFLEDEKDDFVYGFIRATEHPSSVVVFASNGDILIPSQVRIVVRLLKIPTGLHVKFETHQSLHVVENTTCGQDENTIIRLRSRADRDNNQEYRAKVQFLRIPWESMAFLTSNREDFVKVVDKEHPWPALR